VFAKSYRDQAAGTTARPLGVIPARPPGRVWIGRDGVGSATDG
jgi:hypothetical protein